MMLGLLAQGAAGDPAIGGFLAAIAVGIAAIGVAGIAYVLSVARRAGYLDSGIVARPARAVEAPPENDGLRVVAAVPVDLGPAKRRELTG